MRRGILILTPVIFFAIACSPTKSIKRDNGKIDVVFVQVNDVYEIAPVAGGREGGMARVATLKKQYLQKNPNTFLLMAGDFLSPSVYNSLQYLGQRIRGRQMVELMTVAGTDLTIFGNHEFDITENELQDRINESQFDWVSSNAFHKKAGKIIPFEKRTAGSTIQIPDRYVMNLKDADGTTARIGFIGLTLPWNKADYVTYTDPFEAAGKIYNELKDSCDAVIAITHQAMEDDIKLAREIPGLTAIIGGHEHDMRYRKVGNVYITKAHANARSAYVVKLAINKKKKQVNVSTDLKYLNESVSPDSITNDYVGKWTRIADDNYAALGFEAKKIVNYAGEPLDGRESEIRVHPTNLTKVVASAIADATPKADIILMNAGSIQVDDILTPPITQYDIIRSMPFGSRIIEADLKGRLITKVLNTGSKNTGLGGFLVYKGVDYNATSKEWMINGKPIEPAKTYRTAITDYLFSGKEVNLDFFNKGNPDVVKVYDADATPGSSTSDIRLALIRYLEKNN